MQPRATGVLFLLALALGAFVYLYEIRGQDSRDEIDRASRRVFPELDADAIEELRFTTADGVAVVIRSVDGSWRLVEPVDFPADDVNVDAIASALANLESESMIDAPVDPEIYGLGSRARRIRFRATERDLALLIGVTTPVGDGVYLGRESDPDWVAVVPGWRLKSFERELRDLRERRVIELDRESVVELRVRWPRGLAELERQPDGWWFSGPGDLAGVRADDDRIDGLLADLDFLRASDFVDGVESEALEQALEAPLLEVELQSRSDAEGGEAPPPRRLRFIQAPAVAGGGVLVREGSAATLYRIDAGRLAELPRQAFDFRFKKLSSFDVAAAKAIELVFSHEEDAGATNETTIRVERDGTHWVSRAETWQAGMASRLVAELAHLEASEIFADALGADELASVGLAPPRVRIRVLGALESEDAIGGEIQLAEIELGTVDPLRGIIARTTGEQVVYRIDPALAEQLPVSLDAYRDAFVQVEERPLGTGP